MHISFEYTAKYFPNYSMLRVGNGRERKGLGWIAALIALRSSRTGDICTYVSVFPDPLVQVSPTFSSLTAE